MNLKSLIFCGAWQVLESESRVKESLVVCDREKEELEVKCSALVKERAEQNQMIRYRPH